MPQFIKMGLGGTGYQGKPGTSERSARKRSQRRKVLPGFPIDRPFESIGEVREYLSGDKIVCLRCGKSYRAIGLHLLKIHGVTPDEYRARYRIPWTYGLVCGESHDLRSEVVRQRIADGWNPGNDSEFFAALLESAEKRECPYKAEIAIENVPKREAKPKPVKPKRVPRPKPAKFGSPEHLEKMRQHGLRHAKESGERLGKYWSGRKQSVEHKAKRMAAQEAYLIRTGKKKPEHVHVESLPCLMCGDDVTQPTAGRKLYCTAKCRSQYYSRKKHSQQATCSLCSDEFTATQSQARRTSNELPVFCSLQCRQSFNGSHRHEA